MTSQEHTDDDRLFEELATALRAVEPDVPLLEHAGQAAFSWLTVDEELEMASLIYDSALDAGSTMRAADTENYRTVLFQWRSVSVQLDRDGDAVVGQVVPPGPRQLIIEGADGTRVPLEVDEMGCFCLEHPPTGPIRLRWEHEGAHLVTGWMRL